jgi:putative DNA primase/helicase
VTLPDKVVKSKRVRRSKKEIVEAEEKPPRTNVENGEGSAASERKEFAVGPLTLQPGQPRQNASGKITLPVNVMREDAIVAPLVLTNVSSGRNEPVRVLKQLLGDDPAHEDIDKELTAILAHAAEQLEQAPRQPGKSAAGGEGDVVRESPIDPHRLAGAWLSRRATHASQGDAAAYYRNQYWRWRGTHWRLVPDNEFKAELNLFCRRDLESFTSCLGEGEEIPAVTRHLISDVVGAIESYTVVSQDTEQPCWRGGGRPVRKNWIALRNGLLDVDAFLGGAEQVLRPHSPLWFSPTCLPYGFNPKADCLHWRNFLRRNLGDDPGKQRLLQQWCGYLLLHDVAQQKFLAMVGEGSNGKSVACEVITAMLGEDSVSTVPLELFGDKFRLVNTLGKLANIAAEVGELDKVAEGYLKAFVVGDPMDFEQKYKPAFTARPTARLMIDTNNVPRFSDKSDGLWRRMLLLPFVVQIPASEAIRGMDKREWWQERGELPGIFNWALAGLADLRKEGGFIVPQSCKTAADEVRLECNPARLFLLENYQPGDGHQFKQIVYRRYAEWCRDRNYKSLADRGFGKEVKRVFRGVSDGKAHNPATSARENSYDGLVPKSEGA